jgi:hypothetical protein
MGQTREGATMATTEDIVMTLRDHQAALRLRYPIQRMARERIELVDA